VSEFGVIEIIFGTLFAVLGWVAKILYTAMREHTIRVVNIVDFAGDIEKLIDTEGGEDIIINRLRCSKRTRD